MTYKKAKLVSGKLTELNQLLTDLSKYELDEGFTLEARARSLALQIQWIVVKLNRDFLSSHNINTNTIPTRKSHNIRMCLI
jgi:sulfur carrier protein ThiS